jgi:hypothetical protein
MDTIYTWSFSDNKDRWKLWYIIAISLILWLAIWGIFTKLYSLSLIIIFISWVYFFIENNSSDVVNISITELGIKINDSFYNYSKIKTFLFVNSWEEMIYLRLFIDDLRVNKIDLRIDNEIWKNLKEILPNFLAESETKSLDIFDKLIIFLKL